MHVCEHPSGKSHVCTCKITRTHSSLYVSCGEFSNEPVRDETVTSVYIGEVHNYKGGFPVGACDDCGEILQHRLHPHGYLEARDFRRVCVCGATSRALIHQMSQV